MNAEQHGKLKQLFEMALDVPPEHRDAFVVEACDGDRTLRDELSSLLDSLDRSDGYFEKVAQEVIVPALSAIERDDRDDPAGGIVSHYELVERIGGGGMGVVYKARDTRLGRTVALKFLPRHHASNPAARARLVAEARAASALDHPNIGVVYEIGEANDGQQFIAMAWYDGETLKERAHSGPLAVTEAVAITSQLGRALSAAHGAGIIHRDVKPANVIVTRSGAVKLVDFGIAKLISEDDDDRHAAAGTVAYMSPEQTLDGPLDARTDIWSLGVVLYEILAGRKPFRGETDAHIVAAIRNEEPASLATIRADVPPRVSSIVEKCLQKNPRNRYETAAELLEALGKWSEDDTARVSGHEPGRNGKLAGAAFRRRKTSAFLLLLSIVVAVAVVWSLRDSEKQLPPPAGAGVTIAVLSFTDPASSDSTRYLTEGLSEDLRAELARISGVAVPSYLSSDPYSVGRTPLVRTARDLGAGFVVTGEVRRDAGAGLAISLRLVDASGRQVWTENFAIGHAELASVSRNAAKAILSELDLPLTRDEKDRLGRAPTSHPQAYDLYLRGRYQELVSLPRIAVASRRAESMRAAQAYYSQARSLDPNFPMVRARLAMTHAWSAITYDTTRARLDQLRLEAENALRLDSTLPDPREALSSYWDRNGNTAKAIEELERGLKQHPNNTDLLLALNGHLIQAGRWEEGVALSERAFRLDPRNPRAAWQSAMAYGRLRRYADGQEALERLIEISPDDHEVKLIRGQAYLRWKGSADMLFAMLKQIPPGWDLRGMATFARYTALRVQQRHREVLSMLDSASTELSRDGLVYHPKSLMRAESHYALGELREARIHYEAARGMMADSLAAHPEDASIHAALGLAYAGLGRKRDAIRAAERAMDLVPVSADSRAATAHMGIAAEIFGRVGELDRAFETLELLLSMPSGREASLPFLRVWPGFDSLRKDPRFEELLERFAAK